MLARILGGDFVTNSKADVRTAASVWLLSAVSYAGRSAPILARLGDVQEAFLSLLGDTSETTQVRTTADLQKLLTE